MGRIKWFLTGSLLLIGLFILALDNWFFQLLNPIRTTLLDSLFVFLTNYGHWLVFFSLANVVLLINFLGKKRISAINNIKMLLPLWAGFLTAGLASIILKVLIVSERPFSALNLEPITGINYSFPLWNTSFPSWHAVSFFVLLPFLNYNQPRFKIIWWALGILVALSRVYIGVHYLSDVLAGGLIGFYIGKFFLGLGLRRFNLISKS